MLFFIAHLDIMYYLTMAHVVRNMSYADVSHIYIYSVFYVLFYT
jgi:hypothetical protein